MHPANILGAAIRIYVLVIVARAIFSWLPPRHRDNELYRFVRTITEPLLKPLRRLLPAAGGVDFSPIVAILLLELIARALLR
ncbi:MAG: YggT family protein [Planctomycetota bacterium]|jgi:YggT family protein